MLKRCLLIIASISILILVVVFGMELRRTAKINEENFKSLATDLYTVQKKMDHLEVQINSLQQTLFNIFFSDSFSDSPLMEGSQQREQSDQDQPISEVLLGSIRFKP